MNEEKKDGILIVDDEHANIMALTHILRPEYTVYAAKNGQDAINSALKLRPDIILLDVIMPDMDGYSVLSALKDNEQTREIPVIFITGMGDTDSEKKGFLLGAADYIAKPFEPVIVKLRVENQIKLIKHMRMLMEKELNERSARAKIDFLMNMSHEMLTPMNAIMGMTQIAKMSKNKSEIDDCLNEIDTASKQLLSQINSLLNTSSLS